MKERIVKGLRLSVLMIQALQVLFLGPSQIGPHDIMNEILEKHNFSSSLIPLVEQ